MIFHGNKTRIESYLRELADLMGLRDWEIRLGEEPPSNRENMASCATIYGRRTATIRFADNWMSLDPEVFRATCVHELLHCHFRPIEEPLRNIKSYIGEAMYVPTYRGMLDASEYAIDGIAEAWARTLPLPLRLDEPEAPEENLLTFPANVDAEERTS